MAYKVIIAEKPSVAAGIAKIVGASTPHRDGPTGYLEGGGYRVTWAFGHLVGLKNPEQMGFSSTALPIMPEKWETKILGKRGKDGKEAVDPMVKKQMATIERLFNGADSIIVATDAGREGELIFRYIYEYLGCTTPFTRLWISSLTDEAITKGLRELKPGKEYDALSDAAHARSEADWRVGYNASRALRIFSGYKGAVSLGRVQTPTLGMICQRYEDNKNFVPTPFWQISVNTAKGNSQFTVLSEQKYSQEQTARMELQRVNNAGELKVTKVEKKQTSTKPPLLYDLTSLQRAANSKYGLTADQTLKIAQTLYEKKFTTYPRTGSRYVPEDVFKTIPGLLQKISSYPELGRHAAALAGKKLCRKSVNDSKVTDHHALLPTGVLPSGLSDTEEKIYRLICGRMIEAFGEDSVADVTNVTLDAGGVVFKAHGSVPVYLGWKAVFGTEAAEDKKEDADDDSADGMLPELREGERLPVQKAEVLQKTNKPLPIYTDSSLLGEMETCGKKIDDETLREAMKDVGLGTPATRAATIEALINREYIERKAKKLLPTEKGMSIWNMVKGRKISDVQLTGEWERDLALVEQGKIDVRQFNSANEKFTLEIIDDLKANCKPIEAGASEKPRNCPRCHKPMVNLKFSLTCTNDECKLRIPKEILGKKLPQKAIDLLADGNQTMEIDGFTGKSGKKFKAVLRFNEEFKLEFCFGDKPQPSGNKIEGKKCPVCGKELKDNGFCLECGCGFKLYKTLLKVPLTKDQIEIMLSGKAAFVKGMAGKSGKAFDAYVTIESGTGKMNFNFNK